MLPFGHFSVLLFGVPPGGDTSNPGFASLFGEKRNSKAKSPGVAAPFPAENSKVFGEITSWTQLLALLTRGMAWKEPLWPSSRGDRLG